MVIHQTKRQTSGTGRGQAENKPCSGSSCPPRRSCCQNAGHLVPLPPSAGTAPSCYLPNQTNKQTSLNGGRASGGGLTLRRRGFGLAAQTESGPNSQPGRRNGVDGARWSEGTQLGTNSPDVNFDLQDTTQAGRTAAEAGPSGLPHPHVSSPNTMRHPQSCSDVMSCQPRSRQAEAGVKATARPRVTGKGVKVSGRQRGDSWGAGCIADGSWAGVRGQPRRPGQERGRRKPPSHRLHICSTNSDGAPPAARPCVQNWGRSREQGRRAALAPSASTPGTRKQTNRWDV